MNKNKILEELLENNPDLKKENIEKIINILSVSNPEVKASDDFKEKLKNRLEIYWSYQKKSFSNYFFFLTPVVWAICIFTFFYIFWDFLGKKELNQEIFLENINPVKIDVLPKEVKNLENSEIKKELNQENILNTDKNFSSWNSFLEKKYKVEKKSVINDEKIEENKIEESFSKEIKKLNVKEDLNSRKIETDDNFVKINNLDSDINQEDFNLDSDIIPVKIHNDIRTFKIDNTEKVFNKDFKSMCLENWFEFYETDSWLVCSTFDKKCFENDFKNGLCDFLK